MTETKIIPFPNQDLTDLTQVQKRSLELDHSTIQIRYAADLGEDYIERLKQFCASSTKSDSC